MTSPIVGVYAIINRTSGRMYVGCSANVTARWATHRAQLAAGRHTTPGLQADWSAHGGEAFEFRLLERLDPATDRQTLLGRERHHMEEHRATLYAPPPGKLTTAQVLEIRARYARGGVSVGELGREYGVFDATISQVVTGKTWRHLPFERKLQINPMVARAWLGYPTRPRCLKIGTLKPARLPAGFTRTQLASLRRTARAGTALS